MAIEKSNKYQSITQLDPASMGPLEDPYMVSEYDNGDLEFDFSEDIEETPEEPREVEDHFENLAEKTEDEQLLNQLGSDAQEKFEEDKQSRAEWLATVNAGLNLLGIKLDESDDPFPGACSAHHPLILEAAVKFQAKAAHELFNPKGPVKTQVIGATTPEKEAQALRVKNHMNYQVMNQMKENFDETEMMLFYLPIVGSGFKKTYYDALLDRPVSVFVPVDQLVVNYYTTNLNSAYCYTQVVERNANDLRKDIQNGLYRDVDLNTPSRTEYPETRQKVDEIQGFHAQADDEVYTLLEQYTYLDLEFDPLRDPDGIALPYVITVENESGTILSIRRNWDENDPLKLPLCPFTHYKFVPGLGFYGLGYIHLLGNFQMTLTSAMRTLVDSGAFASLQGGFVDKRLRIRNNDGPIAPGEFKEVEAGGLELDRAIKILPFKEPSNVLLMMYQAIEARGQKFADSTEQVVSDSTNYGPVGTTMALLEASTKFFSGVHKRLHKSQKQEFEILASLNHRYLGESESFDTVGQTFEISKNDYDGRVDVVPVSDPNMGSHSQKLTVAQAVYTAATQNPAIHDMREVSRHFYGAIGLDEAVIEKFVPNPEQAVESDPITDIMMAQQGKPIKAFPGQDHDSHIAIKSAFLQDPASGANPAMAQVAPRVQANIQEHMILKFQTSVAGTVAGSKPQPGQQEQAIVAQAAQKVAQTNKRLAELEAQGPDTARNKLADAEIMRVINESRKLETEIEDKVMDRTFKALELELKKYAEDNKLLIAQMQAQVKTQDTQMKEMMALLKESMQIKAAAESQETQIDAQKRTTAASLKSKEGTEKAKLETKAAEKPKEPKKT